MCCFCQAEEGGIQKTIELQNGADHMNYVRAIDFAAIERSGPSERFTRRCSITPQCEDLQYPVHQDARWRWLSGRSAHASGGSNFLYLKGTMTIEIKGKEYEVGPGTLVVFPLEWRTATGIGAKNRRCTCR